MDGVIEMVDVGAVVDGFSFLLFPVLGVMQSVSSRYFTAAAFAVVMLGRVAWFQDFKAHSRAFQGPLRGLRCADLCVCAAGCQRC